MDLALRWQVTVRLVHDGQRAATVDGEGVAAVALRAGLAELRMVEHPHAHVVHRRAPVAVTRPRRIAARRSRIVPGATPVWTGSAPV